MKLVFATNNKNKIKEITALLPESLDILSLADINCKEDIPETADTIAGNALQKATYVFDNYGYNCFADESMINRCLKLSFCVAIPTGQLLELQALIPKHPIACRAELDTAIASAPIIIAFAKSSATLNPPVMTSVISLAFLFFLYPYHVFPSHTRLGVVCC